MQTVVASVILLKTVYYLGITAPTGPAIGGIDDEITL